MRYGIECFGKESQAVKNLMSGVDVQGCAVFFRQRIETNAVAG